MPYSVWDRIAKKYDYIWVQKYSLSPTRKKVVEIFNRITTKTYFKVLDIGCGTGQLIEDLAQKHPMSEFVGIDKAHSMITLARAKNPAHAFYVADAEKLDFAAETFDFVVCCHSYPYYSDKRAVVNHIMKLVKKDGYAIFVQASVNNIYDRIVMWFVEKTAEIAQYLSKEQFKNYFRDGFDLIEEFVIKERWYMPNICGFVFRRK